jgi:hypothetical protein
MLNFSWICNVDTTLKAGCISDLIVSNFPLTFLRPCSYVLYILYDYYHPVMVIGHYYNNIIIIIIIN